MVIDNGYWWTRQKGSAMVVHETTSITVDESPSKLGADIRLLGNLLGEIIREQHGDAAFSLVERVRTQARSRREQTTDSAQALALSTTIDALTLDEHRVLIKAFSNYFQLINIAEDQQRVRVLRQREAAGVLGESLEAALRSLSASGVTAASMRDILDRLQVRLVLTATAMRIATAATCCTIWPW
jgi:phosphoenolpyruvate carboxylase